jgi:hypothetical protein
VVIGEKMSQVVDPDTVVYGTNGEVYEDETHRLTGRPLDTGRMLYVKLRKALPEYIEVEVIWDHFSDYLRVQIAGRNSVLDVWQERAVSFKDPYMARSDKIVYIEGIVEQAIEEAIWWHML